MNHDCHACSEYNRLNRRQFLGWTGAAAAGAALAPAWLPRISFAGQGGLNGRDVLVSIFLRGGADGLTMCVPFGDPAYYTLRSTLAIMPPDAGTNQAVDLNGYFGLPGALAPLLEPYQAGKLAIVHAVGMPNNTRSHFDDQRFMELGKARDPFLFTGWLGRHLQTINQAETGAPVRAIGVGYQLQTQLRGGPLSLPVPDLTRYGLTGPTATRPTRLAYLNSRYGGVAEPLKSSGANTFSTVALLNAINFAGYAPQGGAVYNTNSTFHNRLRATAALIKADVGAEAIAIDLDGWDTHSAQGNFVGTMFNNMTTLATGLQAFYRDVIAQGHAVTVVMMTEFGREARENASMGTDHGSASVMFAMGNRINGNRVITSWPTLSNLYANRDLRVTIDYRDVLAEIVQNRLNNLNLASIFPGFTPTFRGVTI